MNATLNIRIDSQLKERGDRVLRENGISTSDVVRALWQEMADTRMLPPFLQSVTAQGKKRKAKAAALETLAGVAEGRLSKLGDEELRAIGMARYE